MNFRTEQHLNPQDVRPQFGQVENDVQKMMFRISSVGAGERSRPDKAADKLTVKSSSLPQVCPHFPAVPIAAAQSLNCRNTVNLVFIDSA
jgi:hypothetical protein